MGFFFTIVALVVALGFTWRTGSYMAAVFDGRVHSWLCGGPIYRCSDESLPGTDWKRYAGAMIIFRRVVVFTTYHSNPRLAPLNPNISEQSDQV